MVSRVPRVVALALALLPLGCVRPTEPARAAAVTVPAPAPAAPAAPTWPDAAPAPDVPTPEAMTETFIAREELPDVHFASGEIRVERRELTTLDAAAAWLKANPSQLVIVEGYTDAVGPRAANLALAERRARWVMDYLVTRGVPAERITAVARGESGILCADPSAACRSRNRRVHFLARESGPRQLSASPSR
ncbi:MAG TPA: OmpA family protein [Methylomirabilota bacterium]|jgi:outer membrane protein OmpA-like peptidoglycan-associated protein